MNKGISLAKGEWLYFLGADDTLAHTTILKSIFSKPLDDKTQLIVGKVRYNWKEGDARILKKNNGLITPSWSMKIWIKNTLHHQAIFYRKTLFASQNYNTSYNLLADYAFNLTLYKKKIAIKIIDTIIAICGTDGLTKNNNWLLYKEEISLKTTESSILLRPFFFLIAYGKFLLKK